MGFSISIVHPTPNPFARNAALALSESGYLNSIITTIAYNPTGNLSKVLQRIPKYGYKIHQELSRRTWIVPPNAKLHTHPIPELIRILSIKAGLSRNRQGCINWVYTSLDQAVSHQYLDHLDAIYAYEDGAATTFQAAKNKNVLCLYDLPIPFYKTSYNIQQEEAQLFPKLASSLQAIDEPSWKLDRKEKEINLADHIFVASSMTHRSLVDAGVSDSKISVIPYGAPIDYFSPKTKLDSVFRVLFTGRIGPRKGVHYLLKAWQNLQLPNSELQLVGINEFPQGCLNDYNYNINIIPSVPHYHLGHFYNNASVFIFPSLVEGFGLVLLEAMACGIPVITTPNTAGPDIMTDGVEGFIVPIRDIEALKEKIEWCYRHPQELIKMGKAARRKAEFLTWDLYRSKLGAKIQNLLESKSHD
jgi:glycosyltransferase involved in cell wall biosynthesis